MLARLLRRPWLLGVALVAVVALLVGGAVAVFGSGGDSAPAAAEGAPPTSAAPAIREVSTAGIAYSPTLVVYNGRSHYGDEQVFRDFEAATGVKLELRGGTGPELFERLKREGADTPADVTSPRTWPTCGGPSRRACCRASPARPCARRSPTRGATPPATGGRCPPGCGCPWSPPSASPQGRSPATPASGTRGSRAAPASGPATTSTTSRSSPTRSRSTAARPPSSCCAPGWPTTPRSSTPTARCSP